MLGQSRCPKRVEIVIEQRDHGSRLTRDRVPADTAFEPGDTEGDALDCAREDQAECLVGVDAAARDVSSRVSATRSGETHLEPGLLRDLVLEAPTDEGLDASGAADGDAFLVAVEIHEQPTGDERGIESLHTFEPLLLGDGEEQLEEPVCHVLVLRGGQRGSGADPVVGAERRPVRGDPAVLEDYLDPSLAGVVRARWIPLAHHVQVRLQNDCGSRLTPVRRRYLHDDVPRHRFLESGSFH